MRNSSSAAAEPSEPSLMGISCRSPGIQFDDEGFGPEDRELEATRQIIWEKLVVRLRTDFSGKIHFEPREKVVDYSI